MTDVGVEMVEYNHFAYYAFKGIACSRHCCWTCQAVTVMRRYNGHACGGNGGSLPDATVSVLFEATEHDNNAGTTGACAFDGDSGIKIMGTTTTDKGC